MPDLEFWRGQSKTQTVKQASHARPSWQVRTSEAGTFRLRAELSGGASAQEDVNVLERTLWD